MLCCIIHVYMYKIVIHTYIYIYIHIHIHIHRILWIICCINISHIILNILYIIPVVILHDQYLRIRDGVDSMYWRRDAACTPPSPHLRIGGLWLPFQSVSGEFTLAMLLLYVHYALRDGQPLKADQYKQ